MRFYEVRELERLSKSKYCNFEIGKVYRHEDIKPLYEDIGTSMQHLVDLGLFEIVGEEEYTYYIEDNSEHIIAYYTNNGNLEERRFFYKEKLQEFLKENGINRYIVKRKKRTSVRYLYQFKGFRQQLDKLREKIAEEHDICVILARSFI